MERGDSYAKFAELYDLMAVEEPDRQRFFSELFRARHVKTVLDCACGTGSDAMLFHSLGFEVFASDLSRSMLSVARRKFRAANADIPLRLVDFHRLPQSYDRRFDAVVCLSNAINEAHVNVDDALRSMAAVLAPKGIIVFDQGQTDFSLKNPPRYVPVVNSASLSRLFAIEYRSDEMTVHVCDFLHDERNARYEYLQSDFDILLRRLEDWKAVVSQLGMDARYYGSWDGELYDPASSMRLIAVLGDGGRRTEEL